MLLPLIGVRLHGWLDEPGRSAFSDDITPA
jgi:hypothetical protein